MSDVTTDTDTDTRQPYQLSYVIRISIASALTAGVAGFTAADMIALSQVSKWLPRAALTVVALVLIVWIAEIRVSRQLARNEAHLAKRLDQVDAHLAELLGRMERRLDRGPARDEYWHIYADVMGDLGGLDGEASTDSGRMPPRP